MDETPAVAYVDEAGGVGYARKLTTTRDSDIGLVAALVFRPGDLAAVCASFQPHFQTFVDAAPPDATLHITDAFQPGNKQWALDAREVREHAFSLLRAHATPVVFEARRLLLERTAHAAAQALADAAYAARRSSIRMSKPRLDPRVEEALMEGLLLKIDAYAEDGAIGTVDLRFDELDDPLLKLYRKVLARLQSVEDETGTRNWIR